MLVSFFVIAYNAGKVVNDLFDDLLNQTYNLHEVEVVLVDSCSEDNTKQCFDNFKSSYGESFYDVIILDNHKKILPCGWNVALSNCHGDVIIRVDAHSRLPNDFISSNVINIQKGERITGGPRTSIADDSDDYQKTLLLAESSMFGSGIAAYRHEEKERYVNTLAHGAYAREVFETVGGYDERLARTEDNEMHYRMRNAGYKLFFDPKIKSYHYPRSSLSKMARQKFLNGYWIGLTMGVCPKCFSLYHFVPAAFVLALLLSAIIMLCGWWIPFVLLLSAYLIGNIGMTVLSVIKEKFRFDFLLLPVMFFILHCSYGIGTLIGLVKMPFWLKSNKECPQIENVRYNLVNLKGR